MKRGEIGGVRGGGGRGEEKVENSGFVYGPEMKRNGNAM
jgi:hypothetical protein